MNVAFHDCVGGCNGCINLSNNSANAGLDDCVSALNTKYDTEVTFQRTNMYYIWYCSRQSQPLQVNTNGVVISRADYWAIAGIGAINAGISAANRGCDRTDRKYD